MSSGSAPLTESDDADKPSVRVAGGSARQAGAAIVAVVLAFCAGKWSASSPAPPPPPTTAEPPAGGPAPAADWAPLPPASAALDRVAFGSCADQQYPAPFWDTIAQLEPDLFIYGGDNVYGDCTGDCAGAGRCDCSTLSAAYDGLSSHPSFLGTKGRLPMVAIWDDHDYGWNDAGQEFVKRDEAKQMFLDFYSVPMSDPRRSRDGLYTSYTYGPPEQRVQIILLDQRYFRGSFVRSSAEDQAAYTPGRERYLPDTDPESSETILGEEQWAWLEEQFSQPATVRVVVASFQLAVVGHGFERWGLLPAELQRFYDLIESTRANGVVILSGDRHIGAIYREPGDQTYETNGVVDGPFSVPYPIYEVTSSALTHTWVGNVDEQTGTVVDEAGPNRLNPLVHVNNFAMVEFDWERNEVTMSLNKAEKTQLQRHADNGAVLQTVTIQLSELVGEDW